ncbi:MAG: hypothetical protein QXS20_03850 [Candidatus Thorarchaeota archaeon]
MMDKEGLKTAAIRAWKQAMRDFFNPPIPNPRIVYRPTSPNYFYIDARWRVHLNTAGVPESLPDDMVGPFLRSVCHHEIQHYIYCPYDSVTGGRMLAAAMTVLEDRETAMLVCNLFEDLVVDSDLMKRYPVLTRQRIEASVNESSRVTTDHSLFWKLIVICGHTMWDIDVPSDLLADDQTCETARAIVEIVRESMSQQRRWPSAVRRIAELISGWMDDTRTPCLGVVMGGSSSEKGRIPPDIDVIMGDFTVSRNIDAIRERSRTDVNDDSRLMERLAEELVKQGGNIGDLKWVYDQVGIGQDDAYWLRYWYRARARGLIRIEMRTKRLAGTVPLSTEVWRLGDPIEELDLVQSLQAFPVLLPNLTTRKWIRTAHEECSETKSFPSLLVVIDSSSSMEWTITGGRESGAYHRALVAAFAAVDFALSRGEEAGVLNFSGNIITCRPTTNRGEIERTLMSYQGDGTVAPVKEIMSISENVHKKLAVLMITDAQIENWTELVSCVATLSRRGHWFVLFHISPEPNTVSEAIAGAGGQVYNISSVDDLPGLVVREMKELYAGRD